MWKRRPFRSGISEGTAMDKPIFDLILSVGLLLLLIAVGYICGSLVERRHFQSLRRREAELADILVFALRFPPPAMDSCRSVLVCGSVVVGMDYFKKTLAGLKNLIGGSLGAYESVVERARREAVVRMKAEAKEQNANCVFNVRFSTANILSGDRSNKGSGCVEVIAYGTALIPD